MAFSNNVGFSFELLVPADDDQLETFPVTRDLLRIKEPGPELLAPMQSRTVP
jgi:hypothetical protein